jgi:hypothetical protein
VTPLAPELAYTEFSADDIETMLHISAEWMARSLPHRYIFSMAVSRELTTLNICHPDGTLLVSTNNQAEPEGDNLLVIAGHLADMLAIARESHVGLLPRNYLHDPKSQ